MQVEAHQRDGQVQVQHDIANSVYQAKVEVVHMNLFVQVSDDHGDEHSAYIGREAHTDQRSDPAGNLRANRHTDQDNSHVLDDIQRRKRLAMALVDLFHGIVQRFRIIRSKLVLFDQQSGHRAAN